MDFLWSTLPRDPIVALTDAPGPSGVHSVLRGRRVPHWRLDYAALIMASVSILLLHSFRLLAGCQRSPVLYIAGFGLSNGSLCNPCFILITQNKRYTGFPQNLQRISPCIFQNFSMTISQFSITISLHKFSI